MEILVFRTNIITQEQKQLLGSLMSRHPDIQRWNVDNWDIDNVLRIESHSNCSNLVVDSLNQAGLICEPLED